MSNSLLSCYNYLVQIKALILLFSLSLVLVACASPVPQETDALYTQAAETIMARYTLEAGQTAVAMLTQIASQATNTPALSTPASTSSPPTLTIPTPSPQPTSPLTETSQPWICNWAELVTDVTIPPGTVLPAGSAFTKIWRLKNIGSCTWTTDYALEFVDGDSMRGEAVIRLPFEVPPGGTIDLAVDLVASTPPGVYVGNWMLRDDTGSRFGIGPGSFSPLSVQIRVAGTPTPQDFVYDFALNYCLAEWSSAAGLLECPGYSLDPRGSVILLEQPELESRRENEPALWTRPNQDGRGFIQGRYPYYRVEDNDRFLAEIGCLNSSQGCSLIFELNYITTNGQLWQLDSWDEIYDGQSTLLNVNLEGLVGRSVSLVLNVRDVGRASSANGFWFRPHITNRFPISGLVLVWQQQSLDGDQCQELRIYLEDDQNGEAIAFSCAGRERGQTDLTRSEVNQLVDWVEQFKPFDAEIYNSEPVRPVNTVISLYGTGRADPDNQVIQSINQLAERLYARGTE